MTVSGGRAGAGRLRAQCSAMLAPGAAVEFPSPRGGASVSGRVRRDGGSYAVVEWEEGGARLTTCMYKGLLAGPAEARDPVEFRQLALFECEVAAPAPRREFRQLSLFDDAPAAAPAVIELSADPEAVAVRVADIRWQGAHSVYLRDVTGLAVASWRRAGYEVVDMSGGRLEARDPRGA